MIKTYISTLLAVLLTGLSGVRAQESLDDVFAQLDAANEPSQPVAQTAPVVEEASIAAPQAAVAVEASPVVAPSAVEASIAPMAANAGSLFEKGQQHYAAGEYDQAMAVFDAMLVADPYDAQAIAYKKRTAQRIAAYEVRKQGASRAQALAEVDASWNPELKSVVAVDSDESATTMSADDIAIQQMEARIKGIVIPSLDFRDANIKDVVLFLTETCRRLDGKGVNILLLGMGSDASSDSNITISIRDLSLYDALNYIVEMASLKFEVKPNAVAVSPVSYVPPADLVLASYDVIPEVGADLEAMSGSDSGGGADDLFGDSSSTDSGAGPVDVSGFFSIVDFPEGSSAVYQPNFHKLFVKNTPKNIKAIENILADLEDEAIKKRSQQVEIEAKFVEFNEGALEELGFDWSVYGNKINGELGLFGNGTAKASGYESGGTAFADVDDSLLVDPATGARILDPASKYDDYDPSDPDRYAQNVFGKSQRSNQSAFQALQSGILSTMGGTPSAMLFSGDNFDLQITAMEQEGTADVLSAPKVTTKSGNEAIITVAEVHRYPQDWDVETGQRTAPVVKPQDWEDFELGVVLKVTPVVDADSNTIDLDLNPSIKKFQGFDEYLVGYNSFENGGNNSSETAGNGDALFAKMPYFETREVQTQVTISDGHTVLMGGLVDERTETFRDQVPFLGDIPYIGRLFRTEGSRSAKKNLVIYVKATQVDDRGMTRTQRELARQAAN
jgi:general secretion pathway protein D